MARPDAKEWGWKLRPSSDSEFEEMMASLDTYLAGKCILPHQRSFGGKSLVALALNISGPLLAPIWAQGAQQVDPLLERVSGWFQSIYQNRFNPHFNSRCFAICLRGTLWRMRFGRTYGPVQLFLSTDWTDTGGMPPDQSLNLLHAIEGLTPAYASRLTETDITAMDSAITLGWEAIEALDSTSGHDMIDLARLDYAHSVDALVSGIAWSKAWWETAQAAEKLMKGLLAIEGASFPTGNDGHKLVKVGDAFIDHFKVDIPQDLLPTVDCRPHVRYGDIKASFDEAYNAHVALLKLIPVLVLAKRRGASRR